MHVNKPMKNCFLKSHGPFDEWELHKEAGSCQPPCLSSVRESTPRAEVEDIAVRNRSVGRIVLGGIAQV